MKRMERELYRVDQLPVLQNRTYDSVDEARSCPRGDMRLVQNTSTGLIYNAAFRSELIRYDANYQNEQAVSPLFRSHLRQVAVIVECSLGTSGLVEVGCGKGYFLEMLAERGCDITGFDPAYEGRNPRVRRHYFQSGVGITANGLILRHVLEHVPDPLAFLRSLKDANGGGGLIYIEVPCFEWICDHRAWFDIFYEHVNYFCLGDFYRIFGHVVASGRLFGGQYLYVVADLSTIRLAQAGSSSVVALPEDFGLGEPPHGDSESCAIWGGASKGVIFALMRERRRHPVSVVVDINPAKQGKYLPGTGLRVHSPQEAMATLPKGTKIYVMNSNYMDEVRHMTHNAYRYIGVD